MGLHVLPESQEAEEVVVQCHWAVEEEASPRVLPESLEAEEVVQYHGAVVEEVDLHVLPESQEEVVVQYHGPECPEVEVEVALQQRLDLEHQVVAEEVVWCRPRAWEVVYRYPKLT